MLTTAGLPRELRNEQLQKALRVVRAGFHLAVRLQTELHRFAAEFVRDLPRGRHGEPGRIALESGQLHERLLALAGGGDHAGIVQAAELGADGAQDHHGILLHGKEILHLPQCELVVAARDRVGDIKGLRVQNRDYDRVDIGPRHVLAGSVKRDLLDFRAKRGHHAVRDEDQVPAQFIGDALSIGAEMAADPGGQVGLRLLGEADHDRLVLHDSREFFHLPVRFVLNRIVHEHHTAVIRQIGEDLPVLLARMLVLLEKVHVIHADQRAFGHHGHGLHRLGQGLRRQRVRVEAVKIEVARRATGELLRQKVKIMLAKIGLFAAEDI